MTKKRIILIGVIVLLLAGGGWWFYSKNSQKDKVTYRAVQVERGILRQDISSAGTIVPETQVEVKSKASGKILKIYVRDGDYVKKGQLLLALDKTDEETKVKQAQANVLSAQARLIQTKDKQAEVLRNEKQIKILLDAKLVSTEDYLKAKTQSNSALADVKMAEASLVNAEESLKSVKLSFADTEICAPINGLILLKSVEEGQIISSGMSSTTGGTLLFTMGDMAKLISKSEVDEVDIGKLQLGQPVEIVVDAYEGKVFNGKLTHIAPQGTNKSNVTVFPIEILITDADKSLLKAGLTDTAKIIVSEKKDVLLLPVYVIQNMERKKAVFVKEGNQYIKKEVKIGLSNFEQVEIISGLNQGDTVYLPIQANSKKDNSKDANQKPNTNNSTRTMRRLASK